MVRSSLILVLSLMIAAGTVQGSDYFYYSGGVVGPPVYGVPAVSYQPAYVVPTPVVAMHPYPVSAVSYSTHYFAPLVPSPAVVPAAVPAYYAPSPVISPWGGTIDSHGRYRSFRRINVQPDGDIIIRFR